MNRRWARWRVPPRPVTPGSGGPATCRRPEIRIGASLGPLFFLSVRQARCGAARDDDLS
ncbi:MAG: hypothetical protein IPQ15_06870 [Betaproteobacteria bacterium]|nr:hypothetical protein [Betaproteobacteria bacterium]